MGQIKWYKRDPGAALNGMMELTLEERGAYNTVLDLIYSRDGNLPNDDRFISGWLRVDVRVWKRIKCNLIEREKLYVQDGQIRNARADVEVLEALSRVGSARDAGLASARSKAAKSNDKSNENNNKAATGVPTDASTTVPTNHNHNHIYTLSTGVDNAAAPPADEQKPDEKSPEFDLRKITFDSICQHLTSRGIAEARARSVTAKWCKAGHTDGQILDALARSVEAKAVEPISFITQILTHAAAQRSNAHERRHETQPAEPSDPIARAVVKRQAARAST